MAEMRPPRGSSQPTKVRVAKRMGTCAVNTRAAEERKPVNNEEAAEGSQSAAAEIIHETLDFSVGPSPGTAPDSQFLPNVQLPDNRIWIGAHGLYSDRYQLNVHLFDQQPRAAL